MATTRERVPTTEEASADADPSSTTHISASSHEVHSESPPDDYLSVIQAATLLTADCLGVGILALPKDVNELGWIVGLGFLIANLPINYYSGKILHVTAAHVENPSNKDGIVRSRETSHVFEMVQTNEAEDAIQQGGDNNHFSPQQPSTTIPRATLRERSVSPHRSDGKGDEQDERTTVPVTIRSDNQFSLPPTGGEAFTYDFIGLTSAITRGRSSSTFYTTLVTVLYFVNIFLVLGDYILVMSYAVAAMLGDNICLPWAGALASILMFALSQLRTMARLGREASIVSLLCLFVVLVQCLVFAQKHEEPPATARTSVVGDSLVLRKFSALASIGFAMGSQKLFLNIRHEMRHREEAPRTLLYSLGTYGTAYIVVVVLAGSDPPSFLFEAIPEGFSRCLAGLLLWIHVAVSYSINSQAICSSLDRKLPFWPETPGAKWMLLTGAMALSSYTVANAIPFFQDLVSLIGALTSIPLTLTLPALLYRSAIQQVSFWRYVVGSTSSYSLLLYSMVFLLVGLAGALYSIDRDWANQGKPFSCH